MMLNTFVIIFTLLFGVPASAQQQAEQTLSPAERVAKEYEQPKKEEQVEVITRPKVEYSTAKRDPFEKVIINKSKEVARIQPSEDSASKSLIDSLSVQGLIWGGNFPQAIINNKVYKVGDAIQEASISKIDKSGIIVLLGGKQYILTPSSAGSGAKEIINKGGAK